MTARRSLEGLHALVTGAGSGIGRELARQLTACGVRVTGVGRTEAKLASLAEELGSAFDYRCFDVTDAEAWASLEFPEGLDILINNAGVMPPVKYYDGGTDEARRTMETDFFSVLHSVGALRPVLARSKRPTVINISSASVFAAMPGMSMYCASKAAVRSFTDAISVELGKRWHIAAVCPGFVRTDLFRDCAELSPLVLRFCMPPEKMAKKIVRGIRARRRMMVIGPDAHIMVILHVLLGQHALDLFAWVLRRSGIELFKNAFPSE